MAKTIIVVAPHPDDETIGCGGTLLRHAAEGDSIHWLIVTAMTAAYSPVRRRKREAEIRRVAAEYGFASIHQLRLPAAGLDKLPVSAIIDKMNAVLDKVRPEIMYLPFHRDAHSDHKAVFEAVTACAKWFRNPSLKRVLSYETLSQTNMDIDPGSSGFKPNVFVDIAGHLEKKLRILKIYGSEIAPFPFPRSVEAVRMLAGVRGTAAGLHAAEAFTLLKEIL